MTAASRMWVLVSLLVACAAAVTWDRLRARPDATLSAAVERARPAAAPGRDASRDPARDPPRERTPATKSPGPQTVASLRSREAFGPAATDAFQSVAPPALPVQRAFAPVATAPLPPATAPAVPFTVLGKKFELGVWEVYLGSGEQLYVAKVGMVLAEHYRVDAIGPSEIKLTYLPLNERQTLQTGASFHD